MCFDLAVSLRGGFPNSHMSVQGCLLCCYFFYNERLALTQMFINRVQVKFFNVAYMQCSELVE